MRWPKDLWNLPKATSTINSITKFDNEFFNIDDLIADQTDAGTRIALEVVYEAIVDAGLDPADLRGPRSGILFARWMDDYKQVFDSPQHYDRLIAHHFDLRGLSASVDAACSSGLQCIEKAVSSIRRGYLDAAIVVASNLLLQPMIVSLFQKLNSLSPEGKTKFWDAR